MHRRSAKITAMLFIVLLLAVGVVSSPIAAAASQTWKFSSSAHPTLGGAVRTQFNGGGGATGDVSSSPRRFVADEAATIDMTFPAGTWTGQVRMNPGARTVTSITVEIGKWNPTTSAFTVVGSQVFGTSFSGGAKDHTVSIPLAAFTITQGHYLATRMTWTQTGTGTQSSIVTGNPSYIISPSSDPGYPTFEVSSMLLLGVGLVGAAAFVHRRRRT